MNDTDEPDEFQITVVRAKDDVPLEADWPNLIESDNICYSKKSLKKMQTIRFCFFRRLQIE
jgi:hypothetical protein